MEVKHDLSARAAKTAELQSLLRTNPSLNLEFLACISRLFREHGHALAPEVLANLTLSMQGVHLAEAAEAPPVPSPHEPKVVDVYEMQM